MKDVGGGSARGGLLTAPSVVLAGGAERRATVSGCLSLRLTGADGSWLAADPMSC